MVINFEGSKVGGQRESFVVVGLARRGETRLWFIAFVLLDLNASFGLV